MKNKIIIAIVITIVIVGAYFGYVRFTVKKEQKEKSDNEVTATDLNNVVTGESNEDAEPKPEVMEELASSNANLEVKED